MRRVSLVGAAAVLSAGVLGVLLTRVPDVTERPFAETRNRQPSVAVEFSYDTDPAAHGRNRARLLLHLDAPGTLVGHQALRLITATYETAPRLVDARLEIGGTACAFQAERGAQLLNNQPLMLNRVGHCEPLTGAATGRLVLTVTFDGPGRIAAWATPAAQEHGRDAIYTSTMFTSEQQPPLLVGSYVDVSGPPVARLELLAFMWRIPRAPLLAALAAALALFAAGAFAMPAGPLETHARTGVVVRAAAASACVAAGLGLLHALLVPPFQAADESIHFVSYSLVTQSGGAFEDDLAAWVRAVHFQRIRFDPAERFRPIDRHSPDPDPFRIEMPYEPQRSSTMMQLWSLIHAVTGRRPASETFLLLRLVNVALFTLAVATATACVTMCGGAPWRHLFGLMLLVVPTLPFFGMHVSNHSVLAWTYVGIAGALVALMLDGPRAHLAGPLLGLATAIALATGRSAVPLLPLVGAALLGRIVLGGRRGYRGIPLAATILFWGGLAAGFAAGSLILLPQYRFYVAETIDSHVPAAALPIWRFVTAHERLMALVAALGGIIAETYIGLMRERLPARLASAALGVGRVAAVLMGVWFGAVAMASLLWHLPVLETVRLEARPGVGAYVWDVLRSALTSTRLRGQDFLVSGSFWTGFGWLDVRLPEGVDLALSGLSGALLTLLVYDTARRRDARRLGWIAVLLAGIVVSIAVYAAAIELHSPDFHGRYVLGVYLAAVAVAWSPWLIQDSWSAQHSIRASALALLVGVIHAVSLGAILLRYF